MKISSPGVTMAALPSMISLGLFYSLALHMRHALGNWPSSIGERGFPPLLVTHANVTADFFFILLLSSVFLAPAAMLVCAVTPRWRWSLPYFALYVALFFVCWGLMQLAPEAFLNWWRD